MKKITDWATMSDDEIWSFLNTGGDVNTRDNDQGTILMAAAASANIQLAEELIRRKVDLNAQDSNGVTALMITGGQYKVVGKMMSRLVGMLKRESVVEIRNNLMQIGKLLVQNGAVLKVQKNDGWDALMFWVEAGNVEMARFLIAHGAPIRRHTLDIAKHYQHKEIIQLLQRQ